MNKEELFMKKFGDETVFCLEYDKETLKDLVIKLQQENKQLKEELTEKNKIIEALKNNLKYKVDSWEKQAEEWAKSGFCEFGYQSTTAIVCKDLLREIEELEKGSEE